MAEKNREQRRLAKFGRHRAEPKGGWPQSQPNPVLGEPEAKDEATTGAPDQDQTEMTGPGTGGATEQAGRVPRHEGTHATKSAKG